MNGSLSRSLFDALGEVHRFDDLEELLEFTGKTILALGKYTTALVTFYLGDDAYFAVLGCPPGTRERFEEAFLVSTAESRRRKREQIEQYVIADTNIAFIPAGEGPKPARGYVPSRVEGGTWMPDDRLMILMRGWDEDILGVLSLDNPTSGNRPTEEDFPDLVEVDHFVNLVAKICENRFWSLRLEESEAAYRGVFDAVTDSLLVLDLEGKIVEANPAASRMHGYSHEEIIGLPMQDLIPAESRDRFLEAFDQVSSGKEVQLEGRGLRKDGNPFDVEVKARTFLFHGRRHLLAVIRDITERKRMFGRLLRRQKEESIIALAGGVAHDFNNILMGITGSLSLLKHRLPPSGDSYRQCERIETSAHRLSALTGQLLAVAGGIQSEPRPLALAEVIEESTSLLQGVARSRVGIAVDVPGDLWTVDADRVQLNQILLNLCLNAMEAMERGGTIAILTENERQEESFTCSHTGAHPAGDYVRLVVSDDGVGMDAETLSRIFEPFYSTKASGRGLGLAAVLGILQRHRGAVSIESEPGAGTRVEIFLPRGTREKGRPAPPRPAPEPEGGRRTVLLVDDEEVVRDVAGEMLDVLGYEVIFADCGRQAIEIYRREGEQVHLVLLDVQMPSMSGLEVAEKLREIDPAVTILLASGHTKARVEEDLSGDGAASGFIQKPYSLEGLADALKAATGG